MTKRKASGSSSAPARATRSATRSGKAGLTPPVDNPQQKKPKSSGGGSSSAGGGDAAEKPQPRCGLPRLIPRRFPRVPPAMSNSGHGEIAVVIGYCVPVVISDEVREKAEEVKKGLEKAKPGIKVLLNPAEPRFDRFEIRLEIGSEVLVLESLVMDEDEIKNLDVNEIVSRVVQGIP